MSHDVSWSTASPHSHLSPVSFLTDLPLYDRYEYLWEDGVKYKRPTKLPAPEYVDALMNWVQNLLEDESVFPNKVGKSLSLPYLGNLHTDLIKHC